jgi:hypothetical protein
MHEITEAPGAAGFADTGFTLRTAVTLAGDGLVGRWSIVAAGVERASGDVTLAEAASLPPPRRDDWALFACMADAVRLGGTIIADGVVSRRALAEAAEVSRAWASFGQGAQAVTFMAREMAEGAAEGEEDAAILAIPAGSDPAHAAPEGVTVSRVVMPGPLPPGAVARAAEAGRRLVSLTAPGQAGPEPGYFTRVTRLAAALHLLAGEARFGLLLVEPEAAPRIGPSVSPAHVSAFLSGGAMKVIPLLDPPAGGPLAAPPSQPASRPLTVEFAQARRGGATRRSLILSGLADRPAGESLEMWWEMPGEVPLPEPAVLDQMVASCVIPALLRGQDIDVRGPLSRMALVQLPLLAATRHDWGVKGPRREIGLRAAAVLDPPPARSPPQAVLTFSGGVDSFYSLLWRTGPDAPVAEPPLAAAVLSLGFDIPLAQEAAFERHRAKLAAVLERRGVVLHVVHSNARELGLSHWDYVAMPMISAALSQFSHLYAWGIVGGARSYPLTTVPTIQSPLVDCAVSGDWFSVAADGVGIGRTDKVALICEHPDALAALRVCYDEGSADFARNCCRCGKCHRTMLNFLALGQPHPPCFDTVPPPMELAEIPFHKATDLEFADDVIAYARAHGHGGAWADRLEERRKEWVPPATTLAGRVRAKAVLWGRRMKKDPVGTPGLAVRKALSRLARGGRRG